MARRRSRAIQASLIDHRHYGQYRPRQCGVGVGNRTKVRLGKLPTAAELAADFAGHLEREGFQVLPISGEHAIRAGLLPGGHKDPFDRMLIAQSQAENLALVSNETVFDSHGVRRIW